MKATAGFLIVVASAAVLTGCAATTLPEFEAEQTSRDLVPDADALPDIDADSARFVGDVEGYSLYLARGENDTLCTVLLRDDQWEQTACGSDSGVGLALPNGTLIEAGTFSFPANEIGSRERTALSDSVSIIGAP